MDVKTITPILNVSDIAASFAWFEKWGWKKCWDWGTPPIFGAVGAGESEIFLCQGGQGGRGKGPNTTTLDRKSTRLNSSHQIISHAVFCLKKKNVRKFPVLATYAGC